MLTCAVVAEPKIILAKALRTSCLDCTAEKEKRPYQAAWYPNSQTAASPKGARTCWVSGTRTMSGVVRSKAVDAITHIADKHVLRYPTARICAG